MVLCTFESKTLLSWDLLMRYFYPKMTKSDLGECGLSVEKMDVLWVTLIVAPYVTVFSMHSA